MPDTSQILCQICALPAHGNHFGAVSCRACSAFFRRSILEKNAENFKCLRGNNTCEVKLAGKFYCKKCRLKRCYETGMDPKYFQLDRDKIKPRQIPKTVATLVGRPSYIVHCAPPEHNSKKGILDVSYLIVKAHNCLDFPPQMFNKNLTILEKMQCANEFLDSFENLTNSEMLTKIPMMQYPVINKQFFLHFWELDFLKTAKWLSFLDGFYSLPRGVQMQILMSTWHLRARLHRLSQTAKLRKSEDIGKNDFMMSKNSCLDLKTCQLDVSWCTDYPNEQIQFFLENSDDWVHNEVVDLIVELNPSEIEMTFMTCQFCFHYAGKREQGHILSVMEKYLDLISNDLHRYYQDKGIRNYTERVTKMMKINNWLQKIIWEKRWKRELAEKFDIFHLHFSHPEMFYDCC
ncbi:Nuclear Hormone Receptor family [Caenorhabditis elegans]|uniref:Nuclear Hormone Receptor family n=1 Tax=Caenorhabditis elegans TaxID=6239 RepID=H2L0I0_CAEEL|nr:Nuclear Hormone Receptor family [Caenorhabditis elegans]CCD73121.1 Nuclear Hormone Receptor family [Caenorhabditis elegans]|eukprot:NP_503217.2 Nuclear Hormone Receptor family [Caenorhabditis elegans]